MNPQTLSDTETRNDVKKIDVQEDDIGRYVYTKTVERSTGTSKLKAYIDLDNILLVNDNAKDSQTLSLATLRELQTYADIFHHDGRSNLSQSDRCPGCHRKGHPHEGQYRCNEDQCRVDTFGNT